MASAARGARSAGWTTGRRHLETRPIIRVIGTPSIETGFLPLLAQQFEQPLRGRRLGNAF